MPKTFSNIGGTATAWTKNVIGNIIGGDPSYAYNGSIDDVRIYNRALSANEIKQYYDATSGGHFLTGSPSNPNLPHANSTVTSGLLGYWPLDGSARDNSGNKYHGTVVGGAVGEVGKVNSAILFDGTDDS